MSSEEKITATSCAYLTDEFMQSLVSKKTEDNGQDEQEDESFLEQIGISKDDDEKADAPFKYSLEVEPMTH